MSFTAHTAAGRYDLMRGGSELVDLSLLAARTAAVLRRYADGGELLPEDELVLEAMNELLSDAAHAVEFFGSEGRDGDPPSGALAARVDAAIDAVLDERMQPADPEELSAKLTRLADRLRAIREPWSAGEAVTLASFFAGLSRSVLSQTGHVGEVTASL